MKKVMNIIGLVLLSFVLSCSKSTMNAHLDGTQSASNPLLNAKKTQMGADSSSSIDGNSATGTDSETGGTAEPSKPKEDLSKDDWFNASHFDGTGGIGVNKAIELLGNPIKEVIVAVIDSGVDVNHEDLQGKIWINKNEIPGDGIDNDKNGYIDDIAGWNFLGVKEGNASFNLSKLKDTILMTRGNDKFQINEETLEVTREMVRLRKQVEIDGDLLSESDQKYYKKLGLYKKAELDYAKSILESSKCDPNAKEPVGYCKRVLDYVKKQTQQYLNEKFTNPLRAKLNEEKALYGIGYGNNDVQGPDAGHGTHVAGIIAATRDNGKGINGVASNVKIMALRAVPDGDEYDEDISNSIRYAVDNGASVINMSFGKAFSANKNSVQKAIKYAQKNGVLLVHAAGNDGKEIDETNNFPNKKLSFKKANNYLSVGASTKAVDYVQRTLADGEVISGLVANFSNYSYEYVDIFAPGYNIGSTVPGNKYDAYSGTSMAAPVAAGAAAFLISHFPELNAKETKEVLMQSSRQYNGLQIINPVEELFSQLSQSGGVVDLEKAVESLLSK